MGFFDRFKFDRLKEGLSKTREQIFGKVQRLLMGKSKIDGEMLESLEEILISADVGVATSMKIIESIKERVKREKYENSQELDRLLRDELQKHLVNGSASQNEEPFVIPANHRPHVIMVVGVNGVGKTTTIGKLAHNYKTAGKKVLIAAADTFRAAANEQ